MIGVGLELLTHRVLCEFLSAVVLLDSRLFEHNNILQLILDDSFGKGDHKQGKGNQKYVALSQKFM